MIYSKKSGFTLIELLVVISIIGLLSSIVLASLSSARQKAQVAAVAQEFQQIRSALELYRLKYGTVPNELTWDSEGQTSFSLEYNTADESFDNSNGLGLLITEKLIPSITPPPTGLEFGYFSHPALYSLSPGSGGESPYYCGDTPWGSYTLLVGNDETSNYNLGGAFSTINQDGAPLSFGMVSGPGNIILFTHCITAP